MSEESTVQQHDSVEGDCMLGLWRLGSGQRLPFACVVWRRCVSSLFNHLFFLRADLFQALHSLKAVHALVEVFPLNVALLTGPGLADGMGTLDPLLLKGMAEGRPLARLLAALSQQPLVHIDAQL